MSAFRLCRGFGRILNISVLAMSTALVAPAMAETIGITSAVNLNAVGTPPARDTRVLQVGLDMFAAEKVETGKVGQTHLIFEDGSALTVGPNSSVVLDEFVYDPQAQSGKLVVSVGKGLMRYVGGKISKKTPVLFKTPSSVIGIRGGIAVIEANTPAQVGAAKDQGRDTPLSAVTLIYGKDAFLRSGDRVERMIRPGSRIIQQLDRTVLPALPVPPGLLQSVLNRLEETGNADAGELVNELGASPQALAELAPAAGADIGDEDVATSQLASLGSDIDPGRLVPNLANLSPVGFDDPSEVRDPEQAGNGSDIIPSLPASSTEPPSGTPSGAVGAIKRAADPTFGAGFAAPAGFFPFASVSSLAGGTFNGTLLAGGDLTLPIGTDAFGATSTAQPFGATPLQGLGILSDSGDFLFYELEDPSDGSRLLAYAGNSTPLDAFPTAGVTAYALRDDFTLGGVQIPFVSPFDGFGLIDAGQTPTAYINWNSDIGSTSDPVFPAFYSSTIVVSGSGPGQDSVASVMVGNLFGDGSGGVQPFLLGRFRGSASDTFDNTGYIGLVVAGLEDGNDNFFGQTGAPGGTDTGPENFVLQSVGNQVLPPVGEDFAYGANAVATAVDPGTAGAENQARVMNGFFNGFSIELGASGGLTEIRGQSNVEDDPLGFEIITRPEINQVSVHLETGQIGPGPGLTDLSFGDSTTGSSGRSAFIDNRRFAAIEPVNGNTYNTPLDPLEDEPEFAYVVTGDQVSFVNGAADGVTICDCTFTTWGFMSLAADFAGGAGSEIHLMPWVAGEIADAGRFANLFGQASYQGTVVGTVLRGQATDPGATLHKAFGNIDLQFNFAPNTVTVTGGTISNFDNGGTIVLTNGGQSDAPFFNFGVDTVNSAIPGVVEVTDGRGSGYLTGPGEIPANAIGTGNVSGSLTTNTNIQDYQANFVLFAETDGLVPAVQF